MNTIKGVLIVGLLYAVDISAVAQNKDQDNKTKSKPSNETSRQTITKIIEYIPGVWEIERVYQGKKDITKTDSLAPSQSIEFNREGRYISHTGREQIDSGAYRINEQHAILYLASESNEKPSEWYVSFDKNGLMTMRMKDASKHGESFRYVYRRTGTPTTSNR